MELIFLGVLLGLVRSAFGPFVFDPGWRSTIASSCFDFKVISNLLHCLLYLFSKPLFCSLLMKSGS